jgi:hypothetical protein
MSVEVCGFVALEGPYRSVKVEVCALFSLPPFQILIWTADKGAVRNANI